jgi:hypothetical protein
MLRQHAENERRTWVTEDVRGPPIATHRHKTNGSAGKRLVRCTSLHWEGPKPVTQLVTTIPDSGGPSATVSNFRSHLSSGNRAQCDCLRRNCCAWRCMACRLSDSYGSREAITVSPTDILGPILAGTGVATTSIRTADPGPTGRPADHRAGQADISRAGRSGHELAVRHRPQHQRQPDVLLAAHIRIVSLRARVRSVRKVAADGQPLDDFFARFPRSPGTAAAR